MHALWQAGAVQEVEEALVACVRAAEGLSGQATLRPLYDLYQTMLDRVTEGVFWLGAPHRLCKSHRLIV